MTRADFKAMAVTASGVAHKFKSLIVCPLLLLLRFAFVLNGMGLARLLLILKVRMVSTLSWWWFVLFEVPACSYTEKSILSTFRSSKISCFF